MKKDGYKLILCFVLCIVLLIGCSNKSNIDLLETTEVISTENGASVSAESILDSAETTTSILTENDISCSNESRVDLVETTKKIEPPKNITTLIDTLNANNLKVCHDKINTLSEKISDIIYSEYLEDCKSEESLSWFNGMPDKIDPTFGTEFISARCELIDLTGDGEDELIIQKQIYGGLMWTEFVVYSVKENKRLIYLYRPGIGFDLYTDSDNNVVVLIENDYHHDSDKYFLKFNGEYQNERIPFSFPLSDAFISDAVSLMYFHIDFLSKEVCEAFDGEEIITYDSVDEYEKGVSSYLNTLEKCTCDYIEFQLLNTDFKSQDILKNQIEKYLEENYMITTEINNIK